MALRFVDGVGYYDTTSLLIPKRYNAIGGSTISVESAGGPFGDKWIKIGDSSYIEKALAGTTQTWVVAFRYKPIQYSGNIHRIFTLYVSVTAQISLVDDQGTLKLYRGDYNGTLIGTSATPLLANSWQQLELKVLISNDVGTGTCTVRQDTVSTITFTGDTSAHATLQYADSIRFGGGLYFDHLAGYAHIIIMDTTGSRCNDFLGNRRVQVFMPTSDETYSEFACSTGSDHFELVNEVPPNETDYNESDAAGERDTFGTGSVANSNATIDAVVVTAYCKTDDGGAASLKALVRSGGSDGEGTEVSVPSSYGFVDSFVYVDPGAAPGTPFTVSAVNAAEKGYKRQT